ncbi:MAG TPA: hypothetical protein VGZ90_19810 [Puia sp.]|jgi:hypothetical protein|nr:hypothetical protein [Puia sp.]HEV3225135.1 hypothetical protein [Puia sp.]
MKKFILAVAFIVFLAACVPGHQGQPPTPPGAPAPPPPPPHP